MGRAKLTLHRQDSRERVTCSMLECQGVFGPLGGAAKYFLGLLGRQERPVFSKGQIIADLHAHPYITDRTSLLDTLDVMVDGQITLLAVTVHGIGNRGELDFWRVKSLLAELPSSYGFEDLGLVARVTYKGRQLCLMPAYEQQCGVDRLKGRMDLVAIGLTSETAKEMKALDDTRAKVRLARRHGAIVIAAHPYTIWDPRGPRGIVKFRLPSNSERGFIASSIFPVVDAIDLVAANCVWMVRSNDLAREDYPGKPLCSSDAHGSSAALRRTIGKGGCVFDGAFLAGDTGASMLAELGQLIRRGDFETYLSYFGPIQFLRGIVPALPPED